MSVSCFGIELPSNRLWLRKEECHALRGSGANLDWRAIAQIEFPIYVGDFSFTAKRKFLMRYLFSTTQKPDGFADRATKQSTDKVNDVAMLTRAEVVPLVALCIDFEGWCALFTQRRAVPIVNTLYSRRGGPVVANNR